MKESWIVWPRPASRYSHLGRLISSHQVPKLAKHRRSVRFAGRCLSWWKVSFRPCELPNVDRCGHRGVRETFPSSSFCHADSFCHAYWCGGQGHERICQLWKRKNYANVDIYWKNYETRKGRIVELSNHQRSCVWNKEQIIISFIARFQWTLKG